MVQKLSRWCSLNTTLSEEVNHHHQVPTSLASSDDPRTYLTVVLNPGTGFSFPLNQSNALDLGVIPTLLLIKFHYI
ncbi:uncharacterized protein PGTG_20863 [Puccinia graminis f. sp. tritici CRL 75-36-700-3]|uniref:Uncharacterized protein n=1 Tax=Puccinia graminis f. sp. tritici (strain CRL 75-36-700-3 / race SCCL) TaxID=418459 RepID=H6QPJ6_PUCGT|nr:uncharacterized protein PGTG_20863 [Puccinia graminis f. sp. tritici CRL 75-36-700-3]EHS63881.1 hypothetical protein PGTG_20863 [Puccinia graminis f. sp. tritici CRL 75-36-700-3]